MIEAFFVLLGLSAFLIIPLNWLVVLKFPKKPNVPGSVIPDNWPILIRILVRYMFPFYSIFFIYLTLLTFGGISFIYAVTVVPFVIWEFRVDRKTSKYFALSGLRRPPTIWHAWRTVQVLQLKVNDLLGVYIVPSQTLFGKMVVFATYHIFKHHKDMPRFTSMLLLAWTVGVTVFWCAILLMGGYLHFFTGKVLSSWKYNNWNELSRHERKIMRKFRKSCLPLYIGYGKTYIIKRLSVLKFIRGLTVSIFRALLTLGKNK